LDGGLHHYSYGQIPDVGLEENHDRFPHLLVG
jgi:hypothetical protein